MVFFRSQVWVFWGDVVAHRLGQSLGKGRNDLLGNGLSIVFSFSSVSHYFAAFV